MEGPLRIAIADDHAIFRQGLKSLLHSRSDVMVVAEAERVSEIVPMLARVPVDVLLLDLQMDRNSLAVLETIRDQVRVVVLTMSERAEDAVAAVRAGVRAVVWKHFAVETLMEALHAVREGHVWLPPAVQASVTSMLRDPLQERLSSREREIVRWVALGLRNAEVGERLAISEGTVKKHLNTIFQKIGVRDRVELTRYAIRTGLVSPHEGPS